MTTLHEKPPTAERTVLGEAQITPPLEVQQEFLRIAFEQGDRQGYKPRIVKGSFFDDFSGVMEHVGQELDKLHPSLTPECIMPPAYRSSEAAARIGRIGRDNPSIIDKIGALRNERRRMLEEVAITETIPAMEAQSVPSGLLSVPPYCSQTNKGADCVGACFRMVFEGVAGWAPPQDLLNEQLRSHHSSVRVDDEVLLGVFQTDAFKAMCDKSVTAYELMGTDLAQISRLSEKVKERWPQSDVFCTVYQSSRTVEDPNILHHNVLLEANDGRVVTHDPKKEICGPFYEQSYDEFASRWAVSYNRAHLIVAK